MEKVGKKQKRDIEKNTNRDTLTRSSTQRSPLSDISNVTNISGNPKIRTLLPKTCITTPGSRLFSTPSFTPITPLSNSNNASTISGDSHNRPLLPKSYITTPGSRIFGSQSITAVPLLSNASNVTNENLVNEDNTSLSLRKVGRPLGSKNVDCHIRKSSGPSRKNSSVIQSLKTNLDVELLNSAIDTNYSQSAINKRKQQKQPLVSNSGCVEINVTSKSEVARFNRRQKKLKKAEVSYDDMGNPKNECEHCGAIFWFNERVKRSPLYKRPKFSLCCKNGQVKIPILKELPALLRDLIEGRHEKSRNFKDNIRGYNTMFSFSSMSGKTDKMVNKGQGPYSYTMRGKNDHLIGPMQPKEGQPPQFSQLYIYDEENEVENRINALSKDPTKPSKLDKTIVSDLKEMIDDNNPYAQMYRMAATRIAMKKFTNLKLQIIGKRNRDGRTYNLPTSNEVAALIENDIGLAPDVRDIVVEQKSGSLQHIHEFNPCYLPLQYPLLFPYGEDGFYTEIPRDNPTKSRPTLSLKEFLSFRLQERIKEGSQLMRSGRLLQQFMVDSYVMMDTQRLQWIRHHQPKLRVESYTRLKAAANSGVSGSDAGRRIILPSSYTGGERWTIQNYRDSLAICKWIGYPSLFITFTCNPKWPEIKRYVEEKGCRPEDRPDIISRVFKMKLDEMISDFKDGKVFGSPAASKCQIFRIYF